MQTRTSPTLRAQLELFLPPSQTFHWHKLPRETQRRTVVLLARLLREHEEIPHRRDVAKEGSDE